MRVTSSDAFALEVPAAAVSVGGGQVDIDLGALPVSPASGADDVTWRHGQFYAEEING